MLQEKIERRERKIRVASRDEKVFFKYYTFSIIVKKVLEVLISQPEPRLVNMIFFSMCLQPMIISASTTVSATK